MTTIYDALDLGEIDRPKKGLRYRNVTLASWDAILETKSGSAKAFVWPDEGAFDAKGYWSFNAEHETEFQPIILDRITAGMIDPMPESAESYAKGLRGRNCSPGWIFPP